METVKFSLVCACLVKIGINVWCNKETSMRRWLPAIYVLYIRTLAGTSSQPPNSAPEDFYFGGVVIHLSTDSLLSLIHPLSHLQIGFY